MTHGMLNAIFGFYFGGINLYALAHEGAGAVPLKGWTLLFAIQCSPPESVFKSKEL